MSKIINKVGIVVIWVLAVIGLLSQVPNILKTVIKLLVAIGK